MTTSQKLKIRQREVRARLGELSALDGEDFGDEQRTEVRSLTAEMGDLDTRLTAAELAEGEAAAAAAAREGADDGEGAEIRSLSRRVRLATYISAAHQGIEIRDGAEHEYNQALKLTKPNGFPLRLLAPEAREVEARETTNIDGATTQASWLQRVFAESASMHIGVTHESVAPGAESYPVVTSPASVTSVQRGREEDVTDAAWTVGIARLEPTRASIRMVLTVEDSMRLPGLEAALRRDMAAALMEKIDRTIFIGDSGANETRANIVGFQEASITEHTITQARKIMGPNTLTAFLAGVDGVYASSLEDLRVVASVGSNTLWCSTIFNAAADSMTIKQFLNAAGVTWMTRGGIEANTANNDFGGYIGRGRGIEGSAVSALWSEGQLIRDPYSGAAGGEVALTLNYLWSFGIPRPANYQRIRYVT